MVTHKHAPAPADPQYVVVAKLTEPNYDTEWQFLVTERAFVKRKLAERSKRGLAALTAPGLGFFGKSDWRRYGKALDKYARELGEYAENVHAGILPVKFAVYNGAAKADKMVRVKITVAGGRIDKAKKAPSRPPRLDARDKPWNLKFTLPGGFSRSGIKLTAHAMSAQLSSLNAHDGAMLVNDLVHLHTGPETLVLYDISSHNIARETGPVDFDEN